MNKAQAKWLGEEMGSGPVYRFQRLVFKAPNSYTVEAIENRTGRRREFTSWAEWDHQSGNLLAAADIAALAGVTADAVHQWAKRRPEFRALASETSAGLIWRRGAVIGWLERTGRLSEEVAN